MTKNAKCHRSKQHNNYHWNAIIQEKHGAVNLRLKIYFQRGPFSSKWLHKPEKGPQQHLYSTPYIFISPVLSLRRASHVLEPIIKRSHVAIWKWIQKYSFVLDSFDVDKRDVNSIFIDETEINIGGKKAWLWVAYEPQLKAFLSFHISWHQNSLDAYYFIIKLVKKYGRKTIYTDVALK